ncbi:MAG: UDP-N-acetylmuramoyl-L-alanyl-D-glutamate--2,6-diaminopimelate ligase [Actinobacteria bacterium]|nr:UDP-N-acetylmuramoyl-L-alanyl-D-glutamate--2,6-diaminopimelate ligase [Actinomycetota bacterium]
MVPTPHVPLFEVAAAIDRSEVRGEAGVPIADARYASGEVAPGTLFFCVPGSKTDGHRFAADAVARGAAALVVERWLEELDAPQVRVPSVREAMGPMSAVVFGRPAETMRMVGVTGTNGKTTTTYLLESIFRANGWVPGVIGTTGARVAGDPLPLARTTPEAPDLHRLLVRMLDRGVDAVAMEVSSHALDQHRVGGVRYDVAVFTNLSQDHLDYHPDMAAYFAAKGLLFDRAYSERGVVNVDDPYGWELTRACEIPVVTFGSQERADVRVADAAADAAGISFTADGVRIRSALRGLFNVWNCVAALAAARALGVDDRAIVEGVAALPGVPGRVEPVDEGQEFLVMVDYAHSPDSIDNVLRAARPLASGRLIVVFGCGGDRDRAKSPLMGRAATANADLTVITSDNPRSEDPLAIIADVEPGAKAGVGAYVIEPDRRAAIRLAVREARAGDVVVIAGKGHESGQEFADRTIPFLDRDVAGEELRALREGA